jgi:hypothetical protein
LSSNLASFLRSRESMALPLASRADGRRSKKIEDRRYNAEHFRGARTKNLKPLAPETVGLITHGATRLAPPAIAIASKQ